MKIYISGKISGLSEKEYKENFKKAEDWILKEYGWFAFKWSVNPLNIYRKSKSLNWFYLMQGDIKELRKCTHIALQPNWRKSKGAWVEYLTSRFIFRLKIIKIKYTTL